MLRMPHALSLRDTFFVVEGRIFLPLTVHRFLTGTGRPSKGTGLGSAFPVSEGPKTASPRPGDAARASQDEASSEDERDGVDPSESQRPPAAPPPREEAASPPQAKDASTPRSPAASPSPSLSPEKAASPSKATQSPKAKAAPTPRAQSEAAKASKAAGRGPAPVASARSSEGSPGPEILDTFRSTPKRGGYRDRRGQAEKAVVKPKTPARRARRSETIDDDEEETPKKSNRYKSVRSSKILASYSQPIRTEIRRRFMLLMVLRDGVLLRRGAEHRRLNLGLVCDAIHQVLDDDELIEFRKKTDKPGNL